jgi:translation initiation factor 2 beta subunit (eIF-2beta)/eIF-5
MLFAFKNYEIYRKHDKSLIDLEKKLVQNFTVIKPKKFNEIDNLNCTIDLLRSRISELEMLISKQNTIGQRIDNLIENSNNPEILIERLNAIIKMNK